MEIFNFLLCSSAVKLKIDVGAMEPTEHSRQDRTPLSTVETGGSRNVGQHGAFVLPVSSKQNQSSSVNAEAPQAPMYFSTAEQVLRLISDQYLRGVPPARRDELEDFLTHMKIMRTIITGAEEEHKADEAYFEKALSAG